MSNTIEGLRERLFAVIDAVKAGSMDLEKAKTINDTAQVIVNSAKGRGRLHPRRRWQGRHRVSRRRGRIAAAWRKTPQGYELLVTIPPNTTAFIEPLKKEVGSGMHRFDFPWP